MIVIYIDIHNIITYLLTTNAQLAIYLLTDQHSASNSVSSPADWYSDNL